MCRSSAGNDHRAGAVAELDAVEVDGRRVASCRATGFFGRPDGGDLLQQAGDLLQGRLGALERVVEHGHLVHRLEEALGGQEQGQQDADGEVAAEDPEAAEQQHDGDA